MKISLKVYRNLSYASTLKVRKFYCQHERDTVQRDRNQLLSRTAEKCPLLGSTRRVVVRITTTTTRYVISFVTTTPYVITQKCAVLISAETRNNASRAAVCIYLLPHDKAPWRFE
jgi:hypothetical protein